MSLLASISVHQCDGCSKIIVVNTLEEFRAYSETWHQGIGVDFCDGCKSTETAKKAIADDRSKFNAAVGACAAVSKREGRYVN